MIGRRSLAVAALATLPSGRAARAAWPERPVTLVVPSAAGGTLDTLARLLQEELSRRLGQSVVIENRGGAGGAIGADHVAKSPPDGHRLLAGAVHHAILPAIQRLPYDSRHDLSPVTDIGASPNALIVPAASPARDVAGLVALLRERPGAGYATGGLGTLHHLTGVLFAAEARLDLKPVHYRGSAPALTDLIAGRTAFLFETLPSAMQQIRAGTVRALGVTGAERVPGLPEVPTMAEAGFPAIRATTWYGWFGPGGLPGAVAHRFRDAMRESLDAPALRAAWEANGVTGGGRPVEEFRRFWLAELEGWGERARAARLSAE